MSSAASAASLYEGISPPCVSREDALKGHGFLAAWFSSAYGLGVVLIALGLLKLLPPPVACLYGAFLLCVAPGFALFSLMSVFQEHRYSAFTIFLVSISMGFTYNFTVNILVFLMKLSIDQAFVLHLAGGVLLYACLLRYWIRHSIPRFRPHFSSWRVKVAVFAVLALVVVMVLTVRMPPMQFIEELIVMRKLVNNDFIYWTNLYIGKSELTTYLFVPFYLFISLVSRVAGIDVFATLPYIWPFTAIISVLCMAQISQLLSHRWAGAIFLAAVCICYALLFAIPRPDAFAGPNPFPDRYALSSWLLVPLAMFHFLVHIGHKDINLPTFIGLVYLLVEMTFIHARETLFSLVFVFTVFLVLALDFKAHRQHIVRIFWLVVLVGICLAAYKTVNTHLNADLGVYISGFKSGMIASFKSLWSQYGILAFFHQPPEYPLFNYQHHLYLILEEGGYAFYPFALLLLPVYVWRSDKLSQLFAPVGISLFGLFCIWGGLRLLLCIPVGVPFVMEVASIQSLLVLLVLADMLRLFAQSLVCSGPGRAVNLLIFACAGYAGWRVAAALHQDLHHVAQTWIWVEAGLYLATLAGVVVQARRMRTASASIGSCRPGRTWAVGAVVAVVSLALLWMNPAMRGGKAFPHTFFRQAAGEDRVDAFMSVVRDMPLNLAFESTRSSASYIAAQVPGRAVWLGSDTLTPLLVSNQTTPLLTSNADIIYAYEPNVYLMRKYDAHYATGKYKRFIDFFSALDPASMSNLLQSEQVDMFMMTREDVPAFQTAVRRLDKDTFAFVLVYRDSRYDIYRVDRPGGGNQTSAHEAMLQ